MSFKKVKKEIVKKIIDENAPKLSEDTIIIASARKIKNGQAELEFVQNRPLAGRTSSFLSLLNAGDSRFKPSGTTMRVWALVGLANLERVFPASFTEEDVKILQKEVEAMEERDKENVIQIFRKVSVLRDDRNQDCIPRIIAIETDDVEKLPKSIRDLMKDPDTPQEYKDRYILQTGGEDSEEIVTEEGKRVYRRYELVYGKTLNDPNMQDRLLPGKMLKSEYIKSYGDVTARLNSTKSHEADVLQDFAT